MDANSVSAGSHDHCWSSKIEWHVKNPWDWEGIGFYAGQPGGGGHERYERIPVAEWAGSDQESSIGKEFFRGSMDPVTTVPDCAAGIVVGSLGGVISQTQMDKNCAGGHKLQYPLMVGKNHVSAMEGSGKHEENGIKGCWLEATGTTNDSNCFVGSEINPSSQRNMLLGLGGVNCNYHNANGLHRNNDVINIKDVHGDNSLTCLKLGKRQYFEDSINAKLQLPVSFAAPNSAIIKKPRALPSSSTQPPRCQVEGCNVALTNAKEYHRRHKVCEMHSKSPQVIVLGLEQRFCQQCSRFHVISEFDDAKRSCRRRLAGHNERRRKNSSDALANNTAQEEKRLMGVLGERFPYGRFALPCMSSSSSGRALSLLSSQQTWANSSSSCGDLSSRSSAALRELIAENRAQGVSFSERALIPAHCDEPHKGTSGIRLAQQQQQQQQVQQEVIGNSRFMPGLRSLENHIAAKAGLDEDQVSKKHGGLLGNAIVVRPTLDLMQQSNSLFSLQSGRNRPSSSSSSSEEECDIWKSFEGAHIV